ncbi:MAG: thioredoxin [Nanoarchaeota archaeon]
MEIDVTDKNFEEKVIKKSHEIPVIVDFWASWCSPCLMLKPVLEKIAKEYNKKIILAKLNVEDNQEKAREYNVMSIPNVKCFKNGEVINEFVGVLPESHIREFIEDCL